jgi:hypothetical protein
MKLFQIRVAGITASIAACLWISSLACGQNVPFAVKNSAATNSDTSGVMRVLSGTEISPTKASMIVFSSIGHATSAADPAVARLRDATKWDDPSIAAFMEYAKKTIADSQSYELRTKSALLCGSRDTIKTGTQLTAVLQKIASDVEVNQSQYLADVSRVVGNEGKRKFDEYVLAVRNEIRLSEVDPQKVVQFGANSGMSVSEVVSKLCANY